MSTPLPHHNPFDRAYLLASHCAYDRCLDLECRNTVVKKTGPLTVLMCARFLGYILIEAPTHVGREYFALEVVRCDEDEAIQALAELYKNHFIRCFRLDKSHTLVPSCRSAEEENSLPQTVASHIEAKKKALIRDGHRCMLTEKIDSDSMEADLVAYDDAGVTITRVFDRPTHEDLDIYNKRRHIEAIRAVLGQLGQIQITDELNGVDVHRLENILTLDNVVHGWFGQLKVWLERKPEDPADYYRPAATQLYFIEGFKPEVQLTTPDPRIYPLPDPQYLAIHAACARAAHLSGVAKHIDTASHEMAETEALEDDRGSGDVLHHALMRHLNI
ncbi:hypothetical protein BD779DRAFT_1676583 [Infundibulicybe gibba]|nr:hypothetical protein BD779DRAFT_1676583 [Infundibulicybe gibba]